MSEKEIEEYIEETGGDVQFGLSCFVTCHCGYPMILDTYEIPVGDTTGSQKCYACDHCGEIIDREEGVREDGWPDGISQPSMGVRR